MRLLSDNLLKKLRDGVVIPAHPLALNEDRSLDEEGQRLLSKYYLSAGAGGLAVGVHTTQFSIRDPEINLYEKVLRLAIEEVEKAGKGADTMMVAGVSGTTNQAVSEARLAKESGYHLALVSTNGLSDWTEDQLLNRAREIGKVMPLFGFYLQPAVGGKVLSQAFWEAFSEIESVMAIKMAPFNRYQTLDVVRAVCQSSRNEQISLYTGNDDTIVTDLLTTFSIETPNGLVEKEIVGGLLGHWAVWTHQAVKLLNEIKKIKSEGQIPLSMLTNAVAVTDTNAAFFDASNNFEGCIAGLHEVLRRQGIMRGIWCLDKEEDLSPGQLEEINRIYQAYPHLNDDAFVKDFLAGIKTS